MTLTMPDKTHVSQRWIVDSEGNGHCKLTFHSLCKTVELPVGMIPTLGFVKHLYASFKAAGEGQQHDGH